MKRIILTAILACSVAASATAQTTATAQSGSASNSQSGAVAGSSSNSGIIFNSPSKTTSENTVRYRGGYETVPNVMAPSMSSGHPCAYGQSAGFSILGGGVTGGAQQIDDACLLAQMGLMTEAWAMIAARSPDACAALVATGRIAQGSCEASRNIRSTNPPQTVTPVTASTKSAATAFSKCAVEAGNRIRVKVKAGADKALAVAQCRAQLGM